MPVPRAGDWPLAFSIASRSSRPCGRFPRRRDGLAEVQLLEEVIALVVDDDEGREVLDLDLPDRLHAELGIFHHLDLLDAVLGEIALRLPRRSLAGAFASRLSDFASLNNLREIALAEVQICPDNRGLVTVARIEQTDGPLGQW